MSSGQTARNQKFAFVAPHMERRRNADWVSLTQGMRWKSTCCCLVLCARNSCTHSVFQTGNKGSSSQTTASGFFALAALVISSIPLGSTPHLFHTWVLPWCTWMWACVGQLFVHRVHFVQTLMSDTRCKCHPRTPSRVLWASSSRGWLRGLCVCPKANNSHMRRSPCSPHEMYWVNAHLVLPHICGWAPVETSYKGEDLISSLHPKKAFKHRVPGDQIVRTYPID